MSAPKRIQLKRSKGWRMPENTVKVDRSTKFGNPFRIGEVGPMGRIAPDAEGATGLFRAMLADPEMRAAARYPSDLSPLRGRNLACWCDGKFCHADVLLEIANAQLIVGSGPGTAKEMPDANLTSLPPHREEAT